MSELPRRSSETISAQESVISDELKAKVFISCGQKKGTDEITIARAIAGRLADLGFEFYIAVEEQSLKGVRENIFAQLESSEYFLFIDFKREQIEGGPLHRGSLFSHQELALASSLGLPVVAFQENGVKEQDGLMRFMQTNSTRFDDRSGLPDMVVDKVKGFGWSPRWKNALTLDRPSANHVDATRQTDRVKGRYFHIRVRNLHQRKIALNAYAYLDRIVDLETGLTVPHQTIEFKWEGYTLPNAAILSDSSRNFDAFWIAHHDTQFVQFNLFTDATSFIPRIQSPGRYSLAFIVISENFPPARGTFLLELDGTLEGIRFRPFAPQPE